MKSNHIGRIASAVTTIDNVATLIKFSWTEIMQLPVETSKIPIWIV